MLEYELGRAARKPVLTLEQENDLARRIAIGDEKALAMLIEANMRLVIKIAQAFAGHGLDRDDLAGEGMIGLTRAARQFDPQMGARFSTYAAWWIKQSIKRALDSNSVLHIPDHTRKLLRKWRRKRGLMARELGRVPTVDEVSTALGIGEKQRSTLALAIRAEQAQLENTLPDDDGLDQVADPNTYAPDDCDERLPGAGIPPAKLTDPQIRVLSLRFGIGTGQPALARPQVARLLGYSRDAVRQVEVRALARLREAFVAAGHPACDQLRGCTA